MKKIFISLFLFLPFLSYGQKQIALALKEESQPFPFNRHHIYKVIDSRKDTTTIGIVQTGMFNKKVEATLANGCAAEINSYLQKALPRAAQQDTLYLNILRLVVTEQTGATSETAQLSYKYEVLLWQDSSFYKILEAEDVIKKSGMEVTAKHEQNIRESLRKTMEKLATVDVQLAVKGASATSIPSAAQSTAFPITAATAYTKGIYQTYAEFLNNSPAITREFEIRRKTKSARVWLGTAESKPFYLDESGNKVKVEKEIWGFSDGQKVYIKVNQEYFELLPKGNTFEFWGYRTLAEDTGYLVGGLIGGIPQKTLFKLNLETGIYTRK